MTFLAALGGLVRSGAAAAGRATVGGARAVGRAAVFGIKNEFANRAFNTSNQGLAGYLGRSGSRNSSSTNVTQNDLGVYALSQMLEREFNKIAGLQPPLSGSLSTPLDNIPPVGSDNLPYVVRLLERNILMVDQKVQAIGHDIRKTDDLVKYAKNMLDRTNRLIENNSRALSAQRFKELEDKMEQAQAIASLDARVQEEIQAQINDLEIRLRKEFGNQGGILESILGIFGRGVRGPGASRSRAGSLALLGGVAAGGTVLAPTLTQAALRPNQTLESLQKLDEDQKSLTNFMGQVGSVGDGSSDAPNSADYERLMGRISDSKTDRATMVSTDLYNLAARAAFISADDLHLTSKRSTTMSSDGTITIASKQEIVLSAPLIRLNGIVVTGSADALNEMSEGRGGDRGGGGGGGDTTPTKKQGMWGTDLPFPPKSTPSTPEGVSPLNGDETINATEGGDRVSEAFRYFKSKGWSDEQAAAIVGNLQQESGPTIDFTNNTGDGGAAFGAAQWNINGSPDRYANFKKLYGKDLTDSTWEEQLEFINWELTSSDKNNGMQKRAGDLLKKTTNVKDAALIVSDYYERPNKQYAHNNGRIENSEKILEKKDKYAAQDKENPILTKREQTRSAVFQGEAPEGYRTGMAPLKMTNDGATRHYDIDPKLAANLQEAVYTTYGPGYSVEVYSGGQDEAGRRKLDSSTRHNIDDERHGQAADVYVIDPDGNRVKGDGLGRLGQYWQAKGYGGTGLEMHGGGIHLDNHTDRATTWNYGHETKGARQAVAAGKQGVLPDDLHYIKNDIKPAWAEKIDRDATRGIGPATASIEEPKVSESEQARIDKMYAGIYDQPLATANTMGEVIASQPVMPEDLPPKTIATTPVMPSGPKGRKRKNTHDGVNMSSSDMVSEADSNS